MRDKSLYVYCSYVLHIQFLYTYKFYYLFLSIVYLQAVKAKFILFLFFWVFYMCMCASSFFSYTPRRCSVSCRRAPETGHSKIMCSTVCSRAGSQISTIFLISVSLKNYHGCTCSGVVNQRAGIVQAISFPETCSVQKRVFSFWDNLGWWE